MTAKLKTKPNRPRQAPHEAADGPQRRCIVTRRSVPAAELIRFVRAPDGSVVPDLKHRLPGRGVWVSAERGAVDKAVRGNLFARGLGGDARPDRALADTVGALLKESALGALGLERRAGRLAVGFFEVEGLLRRGGAALLVHAAQAAEDGVRKLAQAAHAGGGAPETCRAFTAAELGLALGRENVIHAALERGRGGEGAVRRCRTYQMYSGGADAGQVAGPSE